MTSESGTQRLGYRPELDGLRAIAVLAVIVFHFWDGARFARGGFLGVDLFFVLSGFLITRLMIEEHQSAGCLNLRAFYRRRAARLAPALLLLCAFVTVDALTWQRLASRADALAGVAVALGYVANWARVFGFDDSPIGHTWSLSIEEQFYLVWPVLFILVVNRWGLRGATRFALIVFVAATGQMAVRSLAGTDQYTLYNGTDAHGAVALMAGCALGGLAPVGPSLAISRLGKTSRAALLPIVAGVIALQFGPEVTNSAYHRGLFAVSAVAFCLVIIAALQPGRPQTLLRNPALVWIGKRSYGIYLWHIPIFLLLVSNSSDGRPDNGSRVTAIALTFIVAAASYKLVEQPARLRIGHPRRQAAPARLRAPDQPVHGQPS